MTINGTRRDVMIQAGALAAIAATPAAAHALPGVTIALFDPRFSDSRAFAEAMKGRGASTASLAEDIGLLWRNQLAGAVRDGARIVGLTTHSDFHISSVFAREAGARAAIVGRHDGRGVPNVIHTVYDQSAAAALARADVDWAAQYAQVLPVQAENGAARVISAPAPRAADYPGTLFSWTIG
jgi:hypothetical protein